MFSLGRFSDPDNELFFLVSDPTSNAEYKAEIGMASLVKRSGESDPGLDRNKFPLPAYLISHRGILVFQPSQPLLRIVDFREAGIGVFPEKEEYLVVLDAFIRSSLIPTSGPDY